MAGLSRNGRALALAAFLLSACATERPPPIAAARIERPPPPQTVSRPATITAADYVANAAWIDLFIIGSSELALQRSANSRTREFAGMMIDAHKGTSAQLSLEGRRLNLLPPASLDGKHQAMLNELAGAADFDATYRRDQFAVNEEALALHRQYAANGTSPTLRLVAAAIVPVIERDSRLLRYL